MPKLTPYLIALASLTITGCTNRTENDPGPGGVTVGEAKALDDAAAMLESRNKPVANQQPIAEEKSLSKK